MDRYARAGRTAAVPRFARARDPGGVEPLAPGRHVVRTRGGRVDQQSLRSAQVFVQGGELLAAHVLRALRGPDLPPLVDIPHAEHRGRESGRALPPDLFGEELLRAGPSWRRRSLSRRGSYGGGGGGSAGTRSARSWTQPQTSRYAIPTSGPGTTGCTRTTPLPSPTHAPAGTARRHRTSDGSAATPTTRCGTSCTQVRAPASRSHGSTRCSSADQSAPHLGYAAEQPEEAPPNVSSRGPGGTAGET